MFCLPLIFTNAGKTPRNLANVDEGFRLLHARELLGDKYFNRSPIFLTEGYSQVNRFVLEEAKFGLPKQYQKKAFRVAQTIITQANLYELDPIFVLAVIKQESSFRPHIVGGVGELGLMQIRPETAKWIAQKFGIKWLGKNSLKDPEYNVIIGVRYLAYLREMFGHGRLYLSAYNIGPKKVNLSLARNYWPKEYSSKVMKKYIDLNKSLATKVTIERFAKGKMVADIVEFE